MAIKIVIEDDDELELRAGGIYRFISDQVEGEHRFVLCLLTEEDRIAYFVCCTSQEGTMNYLIKKNGYDNSTITYFKPTQQNKFTMSTFANCNVVQRHLDWELQEKFISGELTSFGEISESDFEQVREALYNSDDIENIIPKSMVYQEVY